MTPTNELRARLDERGISWWTDKYYRDTNTCWRVGDFEWRASEKKDGKLLIGCTCVKYLTPEQAIAATVGAGTCHTVYLVEVSDDLIESWHPIGVYLHRESAEDCAKALRREEDGIRQFARVVELGMEGAGTCYYIPDDKGFTWWDENDVEHYEEYSAGDECGSASCDKCGYTMMVGDDGWFDGWDEIIEWTEEDGSEHKGYVLKPRFKHCPNCGRKVVSE